MNMEAVIIAAGRGSRLSSYFSPKPLTPIFGLKLIERIILVGKLAGIRDFKIVIGYKASKIRKALGNGERYNVRITYIENPEWEKGNGVSVLKARDYVQGPFLLLMSDHLFNEEILLRLLDAEIDDNECILCVDKNLSGDNFDIDDATKVHYEKDRVKFIHKSLEQYNAIDTGIFLCTPAIFDALEKSVKRGEYSLAAGNQILAKQGKLKILDITGCFWVDVDDEVALKKAQKILINQLFKPTDGPISKTVNRKFSTRISAFLARFNISPNFVTVASFALAIVSALFFAMGGYAHVLIGGILAQLSSIFDGCDGEIARLKFKFSTFGEWLDKVLDRYADGFIILGITYSLWMQTLNEMVWLLGFITVTGTFMNSYTAAIFDGLLTKERIHHSSLRLGRDVRLFIIFLGAMVNQLFFILLVLAFITNAESVRRLFLIKHAVQTPEGY